MRGAARCARAARAAARPGPLFYTLLHALLQDLAEHLLVEDIG